MALLELEQQETSDLLTVGEDGLNDFTEIEAPAPGIYYDMSEAYYHKIRAASNSRLKKMMEFSPAHMRQSMLNPSEPTDAMRLGSAAHCRILQPERFEREYVVQPRFHLMPQNKTKKGEQSQSANTTFVEQSIAQFEIENMGKTIIAYEEAMSVEAMYESLKEYPSIMELLDAPGPVEVCIFWDDEVTGVRCKARIDKLIAIGNHPVILDPKTTTNASDKGFQRVLDKYNYHMQGAMYLDGATAILGVPHNDFVLLPIEKDSNMPNLFRVKDESISIGRIQYRELLAIYKKCEEEGIWPAYLPTQLTNDPIKDITLPPYRFNLN